MLLALLAGTLVLAGCDSQDAEPTPTEQIDAVAIVPDTASIDVGERVAFEVVALTATGDTLRDADLAPTWWSTDPAVFTVEDGTATGRQAGTALCKVEASTDDLQSGPDARGSAAPETTAHSRARRFVGRDSAFVFVF